MKRGYYLAILMLLAVNSMIFTAFSAEKAALTVYAHEGNLGGTLLSGVKVTGQDGANNSFEGMTNSRGAAAINGLPGAWQFTFAKEGYETLKLNYDVNKTDEAAIYLKTANQSQEQVALKIYIHEGSLNGTMLSDVKVTGLDGVNESFEGRTDSSGAVTIKGQPGPWWFTFDKDGYETLKLRYDVFKDDEVAAYLTRTNQTKQS